MRIDLHSHSTRSDGTLSPAALMRHAAEVGLDVLALTDHDACTGWDEAATAASDHGVTLVPGIEISCRWQGQSVHLLGYLFDRDDPPLVAELQRVVRGRDDRLPGMLARLQALGISLDEQDVAAAAGEAAVVGRPHVADALVARGVVADRDEAFDRFLAAGRPAYVDRYAADLGEAIGLVTAAGGATVVAHAWSGRQQRSALDAAGFATLRDTGLTGVEVGHQDHDSAAQEGLRGIAEDLGLVVTGSSDFHGAGKIGFELGCHTTDPEQFHRLVDAARPGAALMTRGSEP